MVRTGEVTTKKQDTWLKLLTQKPFTEKNIEDLIKLVDKGITHPGAQVGGYPEYTGVSHKDSDSDGMPDDWETKHSLNPNDASDAAKDLNGDDTPTSKSSSMDLIPRKDRLERLEEQHRSAGEVNMIVHQRIYARFVPSGKPA